MHNSKAKPENMKLLSLNARGLRNFRKRRALFSCCRKQKVDYPQQNDRALLFYFHTGVQMLEVLQLS